MDEVIVPRKHNSWAEMLEKVGPQITPACQSNFFLLLQFSIFWCQISQAGLSIFILCRQMSLADFSISMFNISRWLRRPKNSPDGLSGTYISLTTWRTICQSQNSTKTFPPHYTWWTMSTGALHNRKSTIKWLTGAPTTPHQGTTSSAFTTRSMFLPYIITIPQGA